MKIHEIVLWVVGIGNAILLFSGFYNGSVPAQVISALSLMLFVFVICVRMARR
jgi:hypothetical protein